MKEQTWSFRGTVPYASTRLPSSSKICGKSQLYSLKTLSTIRCYLGLSTGTRIRETRARSDQVGYMSRDCKKYILRSVLVGALRSARFRFLYAEETVVSTCGRLVGIF